MFNIQFTEHAVDDLQFFPAFEQKQILAEIESHLTVHAGQESENQKRLRPDGLAEWTIRLGGVRVFYDVDLANQIVKIEAVGRKMFI